MYSLVEDVRNNIIQKELTVLFFDTCSILNILNSLHLKGLSESYVTNVIELMKLHDSNILLVTCQNVREEWNDNIDSVLTTMDKEIENTDRNMKIMMGVSNLVLNANYPMPPSISSMQISNHIKSLSENFLNTCLLLARKDDHTLKAMHRVRKNEAPARKGKPEPKDCEIIECFFELCKDLKNNGFQGRTIFVTANKDDFGSPHKLKSPLDTQFNSYNAELVCNIDHALAVARGQA